MRTKLIVQYAVREVTSLVVAGVALFWAAGRLDWLPAWGALGVLLGWLTSTGIIVGFVYPDLLADRTVVLKGAKRWDAVIIGTVGLVQLARYIVAGLDQRYGWTGGFPAAVQLAALAFCAGGYTLFTWATASNPFFSRIMRIQSERGHAVVSAGPYRYVRHPAYLGAIVYEVAVSFLLASWPALAVSTICAGLLLLRTALEDRALHAELPGYAEYAERVRFRLLPGIW